MQERLRTLGGDLTIQSGENGTTVVTILPLAEDEDPASRVDTLLLDFSDEDGTLKRSNSRSQAR